MGIDLAELFGAPPPFAVAALALGAGVVAVQLARRLRRDPDDRVAVRLREHD